MAPCYKIAIIQLHPKVLTFKSKSFFTTTN